jgi:hypothetical protein
MESFKQTKPMETEGGESGKGKTSQMWGDVLRLPVNYKLYSDWLHTTAHPRKP